MKSRNELIKEIAIKLMVARWGNSNYDTDNDYGHHYPSEERIPEKNKLEVRHMQNAWTAVHQAKMLVMEFDEQLDNKADKEG